MGMVPVMVLVAQHQPIITFTAHTPTPMGSVTMLFPDLQQVRNGPPKLIYRKIMAKGRIGITPTITLR